MYPPYDDVAGPSNGIDLNRYPFLQSHSPSNQRMILEILQNSSLSEKQKETKIYMKCNISQWKQYSDWKTAVPAKMRKDSNETNKMIHDLSISLLDIKNSIAELQRNRAECSYRHLLLEMSSQLTDIKQTVDENSMQIANLANSFEAFLGFETEQEVDSEDDDDEEEIGYPPIVIQGPIPRRTPNRPPRSIFDKTPEEQNQFKSIFTTLEEPHRSIFDRTSEEIEEKSKPPRSIFDRTSEKIEEKCPSMPVARNELQVDKNNVEADTTTEPETPYEEFGAMNDTYNTTAVFYDCEEELCPNPPEDVDEQEEIAEFAQEDQYFDEVEEAETQEGMQQAAESEEQAEEEDEPADFQLEEAAQRLTAAEIAEEVKRILEEKANRPASSSEPDQESQPISPEPQSSKATISSTNKFISPKFFGEWCGTRQFMRGNSMVPYNHRFKISMGETPAHIHLGDAEYIVGETNALGQECVKQSDEYFQIKFKDGYEHYTVNGDFLIHSYFGNDGAENNATYSRVINE